jgi:hypothetical protein
VTINLQCGSQEGYSTEQPWVVSAYRPDGSLEPDWLAQLECVLDAADVLGMVVILGLFYFGQDGLLEDENAVETGVRNVIEWLLEREYTNVLIEIDNECDDRYDHEVLKSDRVHELVEIVRGIERGGYRYFVGTSFSGGVVPTDDVVAASDFVLLHGNGVDDPDRIGQMIRTVRNRPSYTEMPVLVNEDDNFDFYDPPNNMLVALANDASWGYFDPGANNYRDGYQCPPVRRGVNTERKEAFFSYLAEITS